MKSAKKKTEKKREGQGLLDVVFSWSFEDAVNKNLYRDKIKEIPETFMSTNEYLKSFINPLLEETRANLYSNMTNSLCNAPACEVLDLKVSKDFKPPKDFYYNVLLKRSREGYYGGSKEVYEPEVGDVIAFSDVRPKRIEDLNRPKISYVIAVVLGKRDYCTGRFPALSSKAITFKNIYGERGRKGDKLFVVHLTSLKTNIRIWTALNMDQQRVNLNIIKAVLQIDPNDEGNCSLCTHEGIEGGNLLSDIHSFGLDNSQKEAVLSCVKAKKCAHRNSVKLIWGPPGTGKTKTVASLLSVLFNMKCRTLTCAPTNIAVIGVAKRLMEVVRGSLRYGSYGLGDIVVFGNGERMKINDHEELGEVFLDNRVDALARCLSPLDGWQVSLNWMINLLEEPEEEYQKYLDKIKEKNEKLEEEEQEIGSSSRDNGNHLNKFSVPTLKEKKNKKVKYQKKSLLGSDDKVVMSNVLQCHRGKDFNGEVTIWTFEEFVLNKYESFASMKVLRVSEMNTGFTPCFLLANWFLKNNNVIFPTKITT